MEYSASQFADEKLLSWILNLMLQSSNQSLGWSHPDLQKLKGKRGEREEMVPLVFIYSLPISLEVAAAELWPGSSVLLIMGSN